jgi:hypothetical protein
MVECLLSLRSRKHIICGLQHTIGMCRTGSSQCKLILCYWKNTIKCAVSTQTMFLRFFSSGMWL